MASSDTSDTRASASERRVLVVADESCLHSNLCRITAEHVEGAQARVLVVAPALNKRLRHYVSDTDQAAQRATAVLDDTLACMRDAGLTAQGEVGDADPLAAIDDSLADFTADEILLATHPDDELNWLERGVVEETRRRFALPVTHVTVPTP